MQLLTTKLFGIHCKTRASAYDSVVNNETNQEVASGALSWSAGIGVLYYNSGTALNDGQVSDLVTAHLTTPDLQV
ncbi:hypothetical protein [Lactobacillus amylolyticus]|uniref:hypothetical protein n=1 Tax=Lactobacillus amylolyticus TaxID=83683 RepID=UPI00248FCE01|nr:hypothetical protein [Lactobacillus amylolyticus]